MSAPEKFLCHQDFQGIHCRPRGVESRKYGKRSLFIKRNDPPFSIKAFKLILPAQMQNRTGEHEKHCHKYGTEISVCILKEYRHSFRETV